jgi:anti-anti-sigma factor
MTILEPVENLLFEARSVETGSQMLFEFEKDHVLIKIHGDFNEKLAIDTRKRLETFARQVDRNVILDLTGSAHMDSSGIGVIVFLFKRLHSAGLSLELRGLQKQPFSCIQGLRINDVIKTTGFDFS